MGLRSAFVCVMLLTWHAAAVAEAPRVFGMFVGVAEYKYSKGKVPGSELEDLGGAPNDIAAMRATLESRLAFSRSVTLLNQDATLFRRRYYVNGAHLGYILYTNDPKMSPGIKTALEQKFREGKGVGNFKSSYIHIPGGTEKAIQIIPIGDISQKDEFLNVKNISANDVLTAHRVPPVLMGIVPSGNSSLGDPEKYEGVYNRTEVRAVCQNFIDINDELPPKLRLKFNFEVEGGNNAK